MNAADLRAFEEDIANEFNAGKIRAPVHLYDGNEDQMIEIFRDVRAEDWVCCSWRSHYQCLLKGVPADELKAEIMVGRSISLCFPKHRIVSSAIVGGILPIALGIALGIKRANGSNRVWCFLGDMTALTGGASECQLYAELWGLPITFVVEDNDISVCTPTRAVWNLPKDSEIISYVLNIRRVTYRNKYPHAGAGKRVQF